MSCRCPCPVVCAEERDCMRDVPAVDPWELPGPWPGWEVPGRNYASAGSRTRPPRPAPAPRLPERPAGIPRATQPNRKKKQVKPLFTGLGAVVAVLALTSSAFAHAHSREKWIAAALIIGVFTLVGFVASRARRPKPDATPARPVYPFSGTGTRR